MSAPQTAETLATLHLPTALAQEIERCAGEQGIDVSPFLALALKAFHLSKARQKLEVLRSEAPSTEYTSEDIERHIHEVRAEPDIRFRTQVQEALDDPRPPVSNRSVKAYFAQRRDALPSQSNATAAWL